MKTLLVSVNSKFTHTALSVWYLMAVCGGDVLEFSVNQPLHQVYMSIFKNKPDNICFSCYIWNIEYVLKLCEMLKKAMPNATIILGGPEVSYNARETINAYSFIDYIICGEGEHALKSLLSGNTLASGILSKSGGDDTFQLISDLDSLPSPYTEDMLNTCKDKAIYYESSRGCPYSCSYCLSSTFAGVRYFSLDRVKSDLSKLNVHRIKFVDRTFNCNKKRTTDIIRYIIDHTKDTHFHFEIAADILDDELIDLLNSAPAGKFQLEIGIQSVNHNTLAAVNRVTDIDKALKNVRKLRKHSTIHLHLDLIAGLPLERLDSFINSFNVIYSERPQMLQLGFLKMLKGAEIRQFGGYEFANFPPYEVISTPYMTAEQLVLLKTIEDMLDRYYNSGRFTLALNYLVKSPFEFYKNLAAQIQFNTPPSNDQLYNSLANLYNHPLVLDLLKLDFLSTNRFGRLPNSLAGKPLQKELCFEYLKQKEPLSPAKERYKNVRFEVFSFDVTHEGYPQTDTVVMFDYSKCDTVTGRYSFTRCVEN